MFLFNLLDNIGVECRRNNLLVGHRLGKLRGQTTGFYDELGVKIEFNWDNSRFNSRGLNNTRLNIAQKREKKKRAGNKRTAEHVEKSVALKLEQKLENAKRM